MIHNLSEEFIEKVYPKLGEDKVWKIYKNYYYKPNQKILDKHFSRWGKLDEMPEWPPRLSYYYGFKIIEDYISEKGEDYINKLMLLTPEKIISNSKYLDKLLCD